MAIISAFPGKSKPKLQSKTVNPQSSQFTVNPDSGYEGLEKVTVTAIQTQTKGVNPKAEDQVITPDSGKYLTQVTVFGAIGGYSTLSDTYNDDTSKLEFSVPVVDGRHPAIIALYSDGHEGTNKQIISAILTKRDGDSIYDAVCWVQTGTDSFDERVITQISIVYNATTKKGILRLPTTTSCVFAGTSLGNQYAVVMTYNDIQAG